MRKIKLLAIGKDEHKNYFIFPKRQYFFKICRQLLIDLGVNKFESNSFARPTDKKWGEPIFDKENKIKNYTDKHCSFNDKKKRYMIEIIFGKDKIFLIIYTKTDKQQEISDIIDKYVKD